MLNRREFARGCAAAAAIGAAPVWAVPRPRSQRIRIGAQTNPFGVPIKPYDRLLEILDILAKLGYASFETSVDSLQPYRDRASECRKAFESRRVQMLAAHASGRLWDRARQAGEVEGLRVIAGWSAQMGATHLIMSGSRLPHVDGKLNEEAARIKAEGMNKVGEACRKEGLKFSYHTHTAEFEDTPSEIDILLKETDPKIVWLNYDVGNAFPKGPDPAEFSAQYVKRISIYHLKDANPGPDGKPIFTDLGTGKINLKGVVAPVLDSDWEGWLVVEREGKWPNPVDDPEGKLRQCRQYLRQITGL
jgi:inosose dehydratase